MRRISIVVSALLLLVAQSLLAQTNEDAAVYASIRSKLIGYSPLQRDIGNLVELFSLRRKIQDPIIAKTLEDFVAAGVLAAGHPRDYWESLRPRLNAPPAFEVSGLVECGGCGGKGVQTIPCTACKGTGKCLDCRGNGGFNRTASLSSFRKEKAHTQHGDGREFVPCTACGGTGKCQPCRGTGKKTASCAICGGMKKAWDIAALRAAAARLHSELLLDVSSKILQDHAAHTAVLIRKGSTTSRGFLARADGKAYVITCAQALLDDGPLRLFDPEGDELPCQEILATPDRDVVFFETTAPAGAKVCTLEDEKAAVRAGHRVSTTALSAETGEALPLFGTILEMDPIWAKTDLSFIGMTAGAPLLDEAGKALALLPHDERSGQVPGRAIRIDNVLGILAKVDLQRLSPLLSCLASVRSTAANADIDLGRAREAGTPLSSYTFTSISNALLKLQGLPSDLPLPGLAHAFAQATSAIEKMGEKCKEYQQSALARSHGPSSPSEPEPEPPPSPDGKSAKLGKWTITGILGAILLLLCTFQLGMSCRRRGATPDAMSSDQSKPSDENVGGANPAAGTKSQDDIVGRIL